MRFSGSDSSCAWIEQSSIARALVPLTESLWSLTSTSKLTLASQEWVIGTRMRCTDYPKRSMGRILLAFRSSYTNTGTIWSLGATEWEAGLAKWSVSRGNMCRGMGLGKHWSRLNGLSWMTWTLLILVLIKRSILSFLRNHISKLLWTTAESTVWASMVSLIGSIPSLKTRRT